MAKNNTTGLTPLFTVNFPNLDQPRAYKDPKSNAEGKPKYSVQALFDLNADLSALKELAKAACQNKWGNDMTKWPQMPDFFRDQSEKAKTVDGKRVLPAGHTEGAKFLYLDSAKKPIVVDQTKTEIKDEDLKSKIYSGCKAVAAVNANAWEMTDRFGTKAGVKFYLNGIQLVSDGPALGGGGTRTEDLFSPVAGAVNAQTSGAPRSAADMFK